MRPSHPQEVRRRVVIDEDLSGIETALADERNPQEIKNVHAFFSELYEKVLSLGGTVSGEHGIGIAKKNYLLRQFGEGGIGVMRRIKEAFDPGGRLNPGKIFIDNESPSTVPTLGGKNV